MSVVETTQRMVLCQDYIKGLHARLRFVRIKASEGEILPAIARALTAELQEALVLHQAALGVLGRELAAQSVAANDPALAVESVD